MAAWFIMKALGRDGVIGGLFICGGSPSESYHQENKVELIKLYK